LKAPFHNPSNDLNGWALKKFLEDIAKSNFKEMTTAQSFLKKASGVIDPHTNKPMMNVMWPRTKQAKTIPFGNVWMMVL